MSEALDLMAALVLEDGRRWGDAAESWQWDDARAILDPEPAAPYHFLTRGRGGSKTADLAGMAVAAMLTQAPAGARAYGFAADREQGRLLVDSILGFKARTPEIGSAIRVDNYRVAATRRDALLEVMAADAASAWGLRPWFTIVDELAQWPATTGPRVLWEAITSGVAKLADGRLAVLTSAGDPAHWSHKVLEHALTDPLWRVHEVPGPVPWLDEARLEEQRRRLPESSYRRLFLNEWVAGEDRLVSPEDLDAALILDGPLAPEAGRRYAVGLDLGLTRDRSVAVVAHGEKLLDADNETQTGTRIVVDRLQVWQGTKAKPVELGEVEAWVDVTARAYNSATIVYDVWQAAQLTQRLKARGVRVEEFTFSSASVARLAATLHQLLRGRTISLPDDPELRDELLNVRLVEKTPGVYRLDHDEGQHDDRAVALALAATHLMTKPALGGVHGFSKRDDDEEPTYRSGDLTLVGERYVDRPS